MLYAWIGASLAIAMVTLLAVATLRPPSCGDGRVMIYSLGQGYFCVVGEKWQRSQ